MLGAYAVVVLAGYAACLALSEDLPQDSRREIQDVEDQVETSSRAIRSLRAQIAAAQQALAIARAVGRHPDWSLLLTMLADSLAGEIVLEHCLLEPVEAEPPAPPAETEEESEADDEPPTTRAEPQAFRLELSGFAKSQTAVSGFILRLEKTGLFDEVRLVKTARQEFLEQKAVAFELECSLGGKERPEP